MKINRYTAMTLINLFSLERQGTPGDDDPYQPPRAELVREGRTVNVTIAGAKLEAQFAVKADTYLLLVSDDCPYEETLRAYLLDGHCKIVDSVILGYAYTAGILRDIRIAADNALDFAFAGTSRFRLTVHARPHHLWNASGGVGEAFRFLWKRRIEVTREASDEQKEGR